MRIEWTLLSEQHSDKTYEQCLSLCCASPICKSFESRDTGGFNCALSSVTRNDTVIGSAYTLSACGEGHWNYYQVKRIDPLKSTDKPHQAFWTELILKLVRKTF